MKTLESLSTLEESDRTVLRDLKERIRRFVPSATVLLYGSAARGIRDAESDLDVLVLTEAPLTAEVADAVTDAVYDLELSRGVVISTLFYSVEEWNAPLVRSTPFRARLEAEAVLL
jgi:predicted nucleotidyltransferase